MTEPRFAKITEYEMDKLRSTLAFLESGIIGGQEAKRNVLVYAGAKITAPNSNTSLIAKKLRSTIRCIDEVKFRQKAKDMLPIDAQVALAHEASKKES